MVEIKILMLCRLFGGFSCPQQTCKLLIIRDALKSMIISILHTSFVTLTIKYLLPFW